MMQFSETSLHHHHQINPSPVFSMLNKTTHFHRIRPWPAADSTPPLKPSSLPFGDANCMEQLLVHCATAIDNNDHTLTQQILWVLNNLASPDGDSTARLTSAFLRSLISRSTLISSGVPFASALSPITTHRFSVLELANFVDLTPWYRFGFTAANSAILDAVDGFPIIHIVDLSTTHCMQIPTLLDAIATRYSQRIAASHLQADDSITPSPPPPPLVRLTVARPVEDIPPLINDVSYDELGSKLVNFACSRNITLEFTLIAANAADGFSSLIDYLSLQNNLNSLEALVINCQMMLHYIPDETVNSSSRSAFLKAVRSLRPAAVVVVEEDADFTSASLVGRLRAAFNYLWIPFDTVDTFLPRGSEQRRWYEAEICWKVENLVAKEGIGRVERQEPRCRWVQRMNGAGFRGAALAEEAVAEVRGMLEEHAAGWGAKREEDDLVLTWKGHNVAFASVWVPSASFD